MEQLFLDFAEAISPALQTLLQALAVILAAQLVAYARKVYQVKSAQLTQEQRYIVDVIMASAVRTAEQVYSDNIEKLRHATTVAETALKRAGIHLDIDEIVSAVEAQVYIEKSRQSDG